MVTTEPNVKKYTPYGNTRKFIVSFAFCAHVDAMKIEKHLPFPLNARRLLELLSYAYVQ